MSGFSGIISINEIPVTAIAKSTEAIKHRGPIQSLFFSCNNGNLLCTINKHEINSGKLPPLTESNAIFGVNTPATNNMQPYFDNETSILFMVDGPLLNHIEIRTKLLPSETFNTPSDSETAFRLYTKFGNKFVEHLRGGFTIVAYNFKDKQLIAWRDRLGIKPFYYALQDGNFVFSSEIKGIFASELINKLTDYQGLAYSMYLGTTPSPLTIYKGISSLRPGHWLSYLHGQEQVKTAHYWRLEYKPSQKPIDFEEFEADLLELCHTYQTDDTHKAIMLSGGIDSGMLAYYFGKTEHKPLCINIFANQHTCDERAFARKNADNAGLKIKYLEIPQTPKEQQLIDYLLTEEEPNSIPEPTIFTCREAREMGINVLYGALGPDEIFGGYHYFATISKLMNINNLLKLVPNFAIPTKHREKIMGIKQYGPEFFPLLSRSVFSWQQISNFLSAHEIETPEHPIAYIAEQVKALNPDFGKMNTLKRAGYLDIFYLISSHHSLRSDLPSARWAIELRSPFIDHLFIEKYFNQTDTFKGINKHLKPRFREYASRVLPREVIEMKKKGFTMPVENWAKGKADYAIKGLKPVTPSQQWYLHMLRNLIKF